MQLICPGAHPLPKAGRELRTAAQHARDSVTQPLRDSLDLNKYLKTSIINIWWDIYIWRPARLRCLVTISH